MNGAQATVVARTGAALTAGGGLLMAQGAPPVSGQGVAGIVTALCGVAMVFTPLFFKNLSEARASRVKDLERENRDKTRRIAELEKVAAKVPINEANIAANQGETEALRETLHSLGKPPAPPPRPNQRRLRPTILIVEDEPDNAFMLKKLLTLEGFATSYAPTMDDAIRLLEFGNPHWLILDLKVQGEDGLDLLRKVRREGLNTHVAIITGAPDPARLDEARALRPDALYTKPLKEEDYRRLVDLILGRPTDPGPVPGGGDPA